MKEKPVISCIYVNYNSTQLLINSLRSLRRSGKVDEVIVIDNASKEPITPLYSEGVKLIRNTVNRGFAAAVNQGLKIAKGDYIVLVNPDTIVTPGALDELIGFMEKTSDAGAVSPQLIYPDMTLQDSARRFPRFKYLLFGRRSLLTKLAPNNPWSSEFLYRDLKKQNKDAVEVEAVLGTFLVLRKEALKDVGPLDENFFFFGEDIDICKRLWNKGWKVYLYRKARVLHFHGMSRKKLRFRTEWEKACSARRFILKHDTPNFIGRLFIDLGLSFYLSTLALKQFFSLFTAEPYWKWETET